MLISENAIILDDVYFIIDRKKKFLLYSPFYVINSVRMLNKK